MNLTEIGAIDLMLGIMCDDEKSKYDYMQPLLRDQESRGSFEFPAQYMFKHVPENIKRADYVQYTVDEMDKYGIDKALVGLDSERNGPADALKRFPDRFMASTGCNPHGGMEEIRRIRQAHEEYGIVAVTAFPAGLFPQVALNDARFYPFYALCVELDIPFFSTVGVPGPRLPMAPQKVEYLDEICWYFPELKFVMRHGAEPWEDLAVKLMLKYPNLYYSTSAFAPKHYPSAIIDYANTRGSEKIMYAGYFPMGLSLERIFRELQDVPFKKDVWPKFLRDNAIRLLKLDS